MYIYIYIDSLVRVLIVKPYGALDAGQRCKETLFLRDSLVRRLILSFYHFIILSFYHFKAVDGGLDAVQRCNETP